MHTYAAGMEMAMHIIVDMTAVVKLNLIANCISSERMLDINTDSVVCVTTHII